MKPLFYVISVLCVISLAFWAYQENYRTRASLRELEQLQGDLGELRELRTVLAAEWAWLNRPERLRELAQLNFDKLGLLPLAADQFSRVDQVAYPPEPEPETKTGERSIDIVGLLERQR